MFITLLIVMFTISVTVSIISAYFFAKPIDKILYKILDDTISDVWGKYMRFAIFIAGISGGVRIWKLENYIPNENSATPPITLNMDRWVLEIYRTIIGALQSIAWMLLVFFIFAMIAYVITKIFNKSEKKKEQ